MYLTHLLSLLLIFVIWNLVNKIFIRIIKVDIKPFKNKALAAIRDLRIRSKTNYPPFYPNGWSYVLLSNKLGINDVKSVIAFGRELIVFRDINGQIHVIEPLSSHLSELGIQSNGIRHATNGQIINSFNIKNDNSNKTNIKIWKALEVNGIIYVWHHSRNEDPSWLPIEYNDNLKLLGLFTDYITATLQDHFENSVDKAHFNVTHRWLIRSPTILGKILSKIFYNTHFPEVRLSNDGSKFNVKVTTTPVLFGKEMGKLLAVKAEIQSVTINILSTKIFGLDFKYHYLVNALNNNTFRATMVIFGKPGYFSRILGFLMRAALSFTAGQDWYIWENNNYNSTPLYREIDKHIMEYRMFCERLFY